MSKVLVTGGAGYVGSVLTQLLLDADHEVRIVDRFFFGSDPLTTVAGNAKLDVVKDDIRYVDPSVMDGIDVVMHLAAIVGDPACDLIPDVAHDINLNGTMHLAGLARQAGVKRFIFSSSCSMYGIGASDRVDEESPMAPVSLYAQSKIDAEERLMEMSSPEFAVTSMRNATVYGLSPRMRFDLVINLMTLYAYTRRKIFVLGGGKQWRPLVHVKDVARAFMKVMASPAEVVGQQAFNVGSAEQNYQVIGLAQMVRDVVPNTELEMVPDNPDKRTYNVRFDKIRDAIDFKVEQSPYEGIVEIKQALERGVIEEALHTKNEAYLRFLLDAERIVRDVSRDGSIF